jgi:hypothetical protein
MYWIAAIGILVKYILINIYRLLNGKKSISYKNIWYGKYKDDGYDTFLKNVSALLFGFIVVIIFIYFSLFHNK